MIARVYLWAAAHDRPVCWACDPGNWDAAARPAAPLPGQSTMSRRTRGAHGERFHAFLAAVGERLSAAGPGRLLRLACLDGKALPVAAHSKDRDARWGRGAGQASRGYELHVIRAAGRAMPLAWAVTPLDVDERHMARRMVKRLDGCGYLLRDGMYDASDLHDRAAAANHRLLGPRRKPGTGRGHRYQSPHRLRCVDQMEPPPGGTAFGPSLYRARAQVERDFGNLVGFGGGLTCLPAWARRIWRVRNWAHAKLLINAARIRVLERHRRRAGA